MYPRHVSKRDAEKVWNALMSKSVAAETIYARLEDRLHGEWKGRKAKYIPYPATFLRSEDWDEEFEAREDDKEMPLLDFVFKNRQKEQKEQELRETAELVRKQMQRDRENWLLEKSFHQHSEKCQWGKVCRFIGPTPQVPDLETILAKMKDE